MLLQSWRWYGPTDPVSLQDVKQAGASGIVTALHHIPHGEVWPVEEIEKRKGIIESEGLNWVVVESVPVHEAIKTGTADAHKYLSNYKTTLKNLAACGIKIICYNFMPVLDWTRTKLDYIVADGSKALMFDWIDLAVFDVNILKREGAAKDYSEDIIALAENRFATYSARELEDLSKNILMGIPQEGNITVEQLLQSIQHYKQIGEEGLRKNLVRFLEEITPICEEEGIKLTIHPDDPPYPILGLPRVVSTRADLEYLAQAVPAKSNGICFCTGSLGAGKFNNSVEIIKAIGDRIYFAHLRNVKKDERGSFYETDHLDGDVDMYGVMKELVTINREREEPIPFRPDHGHQMLDDLNKVTNPGYSAIGRLRGLAELRGLELGIHRSLFHD